MKFLPLISLRLTHNYYSDGRCRDLAISPDSHTRRIFENHRCNFITSFDSALVVLAVDENDRPFVPLPTDTFFRFNLRPIDSKFALFTELHQIQSKAAPVFRNTNGNELSLQFHESYQSEVFSVSTPASDETVVLSGRPINGIDTGHFIITSGHNVKVTRYSELDKRLTVNSGAASKGDEFSVKYPVRASLPHGVFAQVEITEIYELQPSHDNYAEFNISFNAKAAHWKYYVVTDSKNKLEQFSIVDVGNSQQPGLIFSSSNSADISDPSTMDGFELALLQQYNGKKIFRFRTDTLVPCSEKPRKNIELQQDETRVFGNLPNPSPANQAMAGQEYIELFQVIKFVTHSYSNGGV